MLKVEKIRVLRCFFVKCTNISFKCISCMIVPQSGNGLWVTNFNGWQTSHICRRGTGRTLRSLLTRSRFTIYQHQFQFLTEYSVSFYISHFLCTKISPLVSLPYFVLQTSQKTLERLSVQTIRSFKSFLMSRSRSCEIISSLCFLHFGEFLGTASNKQEDLMMNSGRTRISMRN